MINNEKKKRSNMPDINKKRKNPKNGQEVDVEEEKISIEVNRNLFICPNCCNLLHEPIVAVCGHTYCSSCLIKLLKLEEKCLYCGQKLEMIAEKSCELIEKTITKFFKEEYNSRTREIKQMFKVNDNVEILLYKTSNYVLLPHRNLVIQFNEMSFQDKFKDCVEFNNSRFGFFFDSDYSSVGTIAYIKDFIFDHQNDVMTLKVVGQQRFDVVNSETREDGFTYANVKILYDEEEDNNSEILNFLRNYVYIGYGSALESIEENFGRRPLDSIGFIYWLIDFLPIPNKSKQRFIELSSTLERLTALKHIVNYAPINIKN